MRTGFHPLASFGIHGNKTPQRTNSLTAVANNNNAKDSHTHTNTRTQMHRMYPYIDTMPNQCPDFVKVSVRLHNAVSNNFN